ncbi:hypothetical protein BE221DRAFT_78822 [Ostreococcus tauri]|uniref:NAD-dependent epimerase/dehydratase domain-containing protein n=1 Tax=Ostreococcus tauri TaxID=70448 RepID=A0A1Y5I3Z1_OSTTA|nr:hypothetical protein BE221DRAFT_78822 [Ostreococcus tauri]
MSPATTAAAQRVVVFGGSGYVGSAIARALYEASAAAAAASSSSSSSSSSSASSSSSSSALVEIVCASRSGEAPKWASSESWASRATFVQCDAMDATRCEEITRGASAVVTAVGALPFPWVSANDIVRANGDTNIIPGRAAIKNGVTRMVVVGASIPPLVPGLASYARGKANVEAFARDEFALDGRTAVVLKPAAVSGTRRLGGGGIVPLALAMDPARFLLRASGNVALAAARAALGIDDANIAFRIISNRSLIEDYAA